MGRSKSRSSNEVKVFWGKSQPKEQLVSKRQVAGMSHQGLAHAPSGNISAAWGKAATGGSQFSLRPTRKNKNKGKNKSSASASLARVKTVKKSTEKACPGLSAVLGRMLVLITSGVHTRLIRG